MLVSNSPRVLGCVSMKAARPSPAAACSASRSVLPDASEGSSTSLKPAIAADAGLVPWALSGTSTSRRSPSPLARWYARAMSIPASSLSAPALGARLVAAMPDISVR